jgi:trimeric autotransporter adhesin
MKAKSLLLVLLLLCGAAPILAQPEEGGIFSRKESYSVKLGKPARSVASQEATLREIVRVPGAPWLRLHISEYNLGEHSYLILTSLQDQGRQRLDARALPQWGNATAFFNGEAVEVELHVAPGEAGVFVSIGELTVGERQAPGRSKGLPVQKALCGSDDRVASNDVRIGRINRANVPGNTSSAFCTVWLVSNGALLTAGHCVDADPDGNGPMLPDGTIDNRFATGVVEFNVPASQNDGTTVFANPNNQYPIDATRVTWRFDGNGQGLGKDWAVFATGRNPNTGLLPHEAQGDFFRLTNDAPAAGATIQLTGYGTDNGAQNRTLQTSNGPYQMESQNGADIWHSYRVDSQVGNSGGPIIWEDTGLAIGIHTNSGCNNNSNSGNSGTSLEVDALENALQNFPGANTVYVDSAHFRTTLGQDGNIFRPFETVTQGINRAVAGGTVSIVTGQYGVKMNTPISKPVTLRASAGPVTIVGHHH